MTIIKKVLELLFTSSILLASLIPDVENPMYAVSWLIALLSGISFYIIKNESNTELKVNAFFLFLQPLIIGIIFSIFNKSIETMLLISFNTITVFIMYLFIRNPFFSLYQRIGKWAIFVKIVPLMVIFILSLLNLKIIFVMAIALFSWILAVKLTWNLTKVKAS